MPSVKVINQHITANAAVYHGDCVELIKALPDDSVDLTVTSIPFSDQYTYSPSDHDMGNNVGDAGFFEHLSYLLAELHRVTVPGRLVAIHVKDRLRYKNKWGSGGLNPFSDDTTTHMRKAGFQLAARITIATDPVRELQATKRQGLRMMDIKTDASMVSFGIPEYLMVYRKWTDLPDDRSFSRKPVTHDPAEFSLRRWQLEANSIWQSDGGVMAIPPYDHEARVAALESGFDLLPSDDGQTWERKLYTGGKHKGPPIPPNPGAPHVWPDISRMAVLNYAIAKENGDEKHICPLQLDLIERAIRLMSNPRDVVLDPFGGIGSVPFKAVSMGRKAIGFELKESYFKWMCRHVEQAESNETPATLFDMGGDELIDMEASDDVAIA